MARQSLFSYLLGKSNNPAGLCSTLLLAWLANADGSFTKEERLFLERSADTLIESDTPERRAAILEEILRISQGENLDELANACRFLRYRLAPDEKEALIDVMIGMMLGDGRIHLSERFILEFTADLLGIAPGRLEEAYTTATGKPLGRIPDPSSRIWWETRSSKSSVEGAAQMNAMSPYAILGVSSSASLEEIKSAYRRMAMKYHPDRFGNLGPEAQRRANERFVIIQQAYASLAK